MHFLKEIRDLKPEKNFSDQKWPSIIFDITKIKFKKLKFELKFENLQKCLIFQQTFCIT